MNEAKFLSWEPPQLADLPLLEPPIAVQRLKHNQRVGQLLAQTLAGIQDIYDRTCMMHRAALRLEAPEQLAQMTEILIKRRRWELDEVAQYSAPFYQASPCETPQEDGVYDLKAHFSQLRMLVLDYHYQHKALQAAAWNLEEGGMAELAMLLQDCASRLQQDAWFLDAALKRTQRQVSQGK
jgi:hypothetical protein